MTSGGLVGFFRSGLAAVALKRFLRVRPRWPAPPRLGPAVALRFDGLAEHQCFACSPRNPIGLRLEFHEAPGWALACSWVPGEPYGNYPGMLHGGIAATLLDEIIGQAIFLQTGHLPVSVTADLAWWKPLKLGEPITAAARLKARYGNFFAAEAFLFRPDGKVAASASGRYYTPPLEQFRRMAEIAHVPEVARGWFAPAKVGR